MHISTASNSYPSAKQLKNRPNFGASAHEEGSFVASFNRMMHLNETVFQSEGYSKSSGMHHLILASEPGPSVSKTAGELVTEPVGEDVHTVS